MSDFAKFVLGILGFIALGVVLFWLKWNVLWGIPIAAVIGFLLYIVRDIFRCSSLGEAALILVVIIFVLGLLGVLIYFFNWHTCWIISTIVGIFVVSNWLNHKECERLAEEKRKEEERLAEEKLKEDVRINAAQFLEAERLAEEKRKEEERLAEEKRKEEELLAAKRKEAQLLAEEKRKVAERERKLAQERFQAQQLSQANETLETYGNIFDKIFARRILFDSNIWMNGDYDVLFTESFISIKKMHSQIMMPGIQLDEIENLKNSSDESKKYAARCALKRVELAQQKGILALHGVGVGAKKYAYADPEFIKYLLFEASQLPECAGSVFVTDDRALRIRVKAVVKERLEKEVLVLSGEEIFELVNIIASARAVIERYKKR